jgi:L-arabinose isomerase
VMVAAEGEVVDGPPMQLGDTNARVRFAPGVRGFVNAWAEQGPTHHGVMAPGHWVMSLKPLAKLFDVDLRIVC